jgi:hypothetical protein
MRVLQLHEAISHQPMKNYMMYHISPEMTRHVPCIYNSLTCKFIDLHYIIPKKKSSSLTTPLEILECATEHTQGLTSIYNITIQGLTSMKTNYPNQLSINLNQLSNILLYRVSDVILFICTVDGYILMIYWMQ